MLAARLPLTIAALTPNAVVVADALSTALTAVDLLAAVLALAILLLRQTHAYGSGKVRGLRGVCGLRGRRGLRGQRLRRGHCSVSYTHLTLPTNREV